MLTGYVSRYKKIERYGFIDCPDFQLEKIFFHLKACNKRYRHVFAGDKVAFVLLPDPNVEGWYEANNVQFVDNPSLQNLRAGFDNQAVLTGFLKKIQGTYYVKDSETYILIKLSLSKYEINIEENYEAKVNQLVQYRIIIFSEINKIRAINVNRQFTENYYLLAEGLAFDAQVVSHQKGGYKVLVLDEIEGFIPGSIGFERAKPLETGERILVRLIKASEDFDNFIFDIQQDFESRGPLPRA